MVLPDLPRVSQYGRSIAMRSVALKLVAIAAEDRAVLPQILAILVQFTPIALNARGVTLDSPEVAQAMRVRSRENASAVMTAAAASTERPRRALPWRGLGCRAG